MIQTKNILKKERNTVIDGSLASLIAARQLRKYSRIAATVARASPYFVPIESTRNVSNVLSEPCGQFARPRTASKRLEDNSRYNLSFLASYVSFPAVSTVVTIVSPVITYPHPQTVSRPPCPS